MGNKTLPNINPVYSENVQFDIDSNTLKVWNRNVNAAVTSGSTLNIYGRIGDYWYWDDEDRPITVPLVDRFLSDNSGNDITVNINSPGGDFFTGVSVYNLLRQYDGNVTINIIGLAASAASIIAMSGDKILIAESAFVMIHRSWGAVIGNANDFEKALSVFTDLDQAMAQVYALRTNTPESEILQLMDSETQVNGRKAISMGFADDVLGSGEVVIEEPSEENAISRIVENALIQQGMQPTERARVLSKLSFKSEEVSEQDFSGLNASILELHQQIKNRM